MPVWNPFAAPQAAQMPAMPPQAPGSIWNGQPGPSWGGGYFPMPQAAPYTPEAPVFQQPTQALAAMTPGPVPTFDNQAAANANLNVGAPAPTGDPWGAAAKSMTAIDSQQPNNQRIAQANTPPPSSIDMNTGRRMSPMPFDPNRRAMMRGMQQY